MAGKVILLDNDIFFDFSKALLDPQDTLKYQVLIDNGLKDLAELESGQIVNKDEHRMVGHYWLRTPSLAPSKEIEKEIVDSLADLKQFVDAVLKKEISNGLGEPFEGLVYVGIGGSALGPQLIFDAFGEKNSPQILFLDNTDPESVYSLVEDLGNELRKYLIVVASKSGGTRETANMQNELQRVFRENGWNFSENALAITVKGSKLDNQADSESWRKVFHLWDWVGGRTSISSVIGLLPLLFLGKDSDRFLEGLKFADNIGRGNDDNPILLMALEIYLNKKEYARNQLVVLPYKDKLKLFSKYLQQLIMESVGKEVYQQENIIHEGIAVYGNKGSSDQHSYLQQLFDGPDNFTVNFINVRSGKNFMEFLPDGNLSADFLHAFYLGTSKALFNKNRKSVSISIPKVDEFYLGFLIGVYERMVSFYGSFAGINAYNQPAVESGKKAAEKIISNKNRILEIMQGNPEREYDVVKLANMIEADEEEIFSILEHVYSTGIYGVERLKKKDESDFKNIRYKAAK